MQTLRAMLGNYPHTAPLKSGAVTSDRFTLDFVEVKPLSKAFKPMVRELSFDVSEMAIVTFLMAKAHGKPLVLLPATMLGRFQHHCMLHNADRGTIGPGDLAGRRIGVRAYSQTTGVWLRGILKNDYGADVGRAQWVTFEDAHVAEYRDPPGVERSSGDMTAMLLAGELDAAIYGADMPDDPRLKSVIPEPESAAKAWYAKYRVAPINHMVVVNGERAKASPTLATDVYELLLKAKRATPAAGAIDSTPFGIESNRAGLELIIAYAAEQRLIPRRYAVDELFEDQVRKMAS